MGGSTPTGGSPEDRPGGPALVRIRRGAAPGPVPFASNLSPGEAGLLRAAGAEPVSLVAGNSVYYMGTVYGSDWRDTELEALTRALDQATQASVERLCRQAASVGAHGVVGVRLHAVRHDWHDRLVEVALLGTAIRVRDGGQEPPWASTLSGAEWWALGRAGYRPVGLAHGHCAWFVRTTHAEARVLRDPASAELSRWSRALAECRDRACARLAARAAGWGASGVIAVRLERRVERVSLAGYSADPVYRWPHHCLTCSVLGTAVRAGPAWAGTPVSTLVLPLRLRSGEGGAGHGA
jgi:uncharacterized protein YbjQ (UPF0145 family)